MQCDACGREEATVLIGRGDAATRLRLCPSCASKRGVSGAGAALSVDLSALLGDLAPETAARSCPRCGLALAEALRHGRLGCPGCAIEFRDSFAALRSSPAFAGKAPGGAP